MAKRLEKGRREELLDGVMAIIQERGFSDVRVAELARDLHCSVASLYKIAPSKDSLVLVALSQWADRSFAHMDERSAAGATASDRARLYFLAASELLAAQSHRFREDLDRYESTRAAWRVISDRFIDGVIERVGEAAKAGEIRPVNGCWLGEMLRSLARLVRDEPTLARCGMTASEAALEIDHIIWDGVRV